MTAPGGPASVEPGPNAEPDPAEQQFEALAANASAERALEDVQTGEDSSPEQPPIDLTAAAFFDVDNTLVQGSSLIHFGRGLAARKYFTYRDVLGFVYAQAKFQVLGRENSGDVAAGRRKALAFIEGRSTGELTQLGEEVYDEIIAEKIWEGTRDLAQMHLDAGQQVWLVTATPYELAITIARRLGLTGALGTVAESVDGIFTGRLVGDILHGPGKAHAVRFAGAVQEALHRVFRQLQRRAVAVPGRHCRGDQPRHRFARLRPQARLGNPRLPHRPQGRPDRRTVGPGPGRGGRRTGCGGVSAAISLISCAAEHA